MTNATPYIFEDTPDGRSLVVTGAWSAEAAKSLTRGDADGLVLNYARGFIGHDLEFLDEGWPLRRLKVLNRSIEDLTPIGRLAQSLEHLSVQAAPPAELDLGLVPRIRVLGAEWALIGSTLGELEDLREVVTWRFNELDLHAFRDHLELQRLVIKDAPYLESLDGVGNLPELAELSIVLARKLHDISEVSELRSTLQEFKLEACPSISAIDDVEPLVNLRFLGVSDCGEIDSLAPVKALRSLERFSAWGSTRVADGDLSPLAQLRHLREIRMQDRRGYSPRLSDLVSSLSNGRAA